MCVSEQKVMKSFKETYSSGSPRLVAMSVAETMIAFETMLLHRTFSVRDTGIIGALVHHFDHWLIGLRTRGTVLRIDELISPFYTHLFPTPQSNPIVMWERLITAARLDPKQIQQSFRMFLNARFSDLQWPSALEVNWKDFFTYFAEKTWGTPLDAEMKTWIDSYGASPKATDLPEPLHQENKSKSFEELEAIYQAGNESVASMASGAFTIMGSEKWVSNRMSAVLEGWFQDIHKNIGGFPSVQVVREDDQPVNKCVIAILDGGSKILLHISFPTARQTDDSAAEHLVADMQGQLQRFQDHMLKIHKPFYDGVVRFLNQHFGMKFSMRLDFSQVPLSQDANINEDLRNVLQGLKQAIPKWFEMLGSDDARAENVHIFLMRYLNERFFIPRGYVMYSQPTGPPSAMSSFTYAVTKILARAGHVNVHHRDVPFFYVEDGTYLAPPTLGCALIPVQLMVSPPAHYVGNSRQTEKAAVTVISEALNVLDPEHTDQNIAALVENGRTQPFRFKGQTIVVPTFANAPPNLFDPKTETPADIVLRYPVDPSAPKEPTFDVEAAYLAALAGMPPVSLPVPKLTFRKHKKKDKQKNKQQMPGELEEKPTWMSVEMRTVLRGWIQEILPTLPFGVNVEFEELSKEESSKIAKDTVKSIYRLHSHTFIFQMNATTAQQTERNAIQSVISQMSTFPTGARAAIITGRSASYNDVAKELSGFLPMIADDFYNGKPLDRKRIDDRFNSLQTRVPIPDPEFSELKMSLDGLLGLFTEVWKHETIGKEEFVRIAALWFNRRFFLNKDFVSYMTLSGAKAALAVSPILADLGTVPMGEYNSTFYLAQVSGDAGHLINNVYDVVLPFDQQFEFSGKFLPSLEFLNEFFARHPYIDNTMALNTLRLVAEITLGDLSGFVPGRTVEVRRGDEQILVPALNTAPPSPALLPTEKATDIVARYFPVDEPAKPAEKTKKAADLPKPLTPKEILERVDLLWGLTDGDLKKWPSVIAENQEEIKLTQKEAEQNFLSATTDPGFQKIRDRKPANDVVADLVRDHGFNPKKIAAARGTKENVVGGWIQKWFEDRLNANDNNLTKVLEEIEEQNKKDEEVSRDVQKMNPINPDDAREFFRTSLHTKVLRERTPGAIDMRDLIDRLGFDPVKIAKERNVLEKIVAEQWLWPMLEPIYKETQNNMDEWPRALAARGYLFDETDERMSALDFFDSQFFLQSRRDRQPSDAEMITLVGGLGLQPEAIGLLRGVSRSTAQQWLENFLVRNPLYQGRPQTIARAFPSLTKSSVEAWLNDEKNNKGLADRAKTQRAIRPSDEQLDAFIFAPGRPRPTIFDIATHFDVDDAGLVLDWLHDQKTSDLLQQNSLLQSRRGVAARLAVRFHGGFASDPRCASANSVGEYRVLDGRSRAAADGGCSQRI